METKAHGPGHLFIVSAPSGAGKTTLCHAVRKRFPEMHYSISATTRPPRPGETHGVDYHFVTREDFQHRIAEGAWAEWAEVHGHYYGTPADVIDEKRAAGADVLLDIDVQGARQLLHRYPDSVTIFVLPPSVDALRRRLENRGADTPAVIERRLKAAQEEMAESGHYRHVIINDDLDAAISRFVDIIHRSRSGWTAA